MYKVELSRRSYKKFEQIVTSQPKLARRISKVIDILKDDPLIGIPLKGELKNLRKYRVGNYRILYQVNTSILLITIIDLGHRREIYRS